MPSEVTSSLVILATCAFIIRGLLSYMAQSARSSNSEYMVLRKQYEKQGGELLEVKSDRDLWKLKAMKYSDERNSAIKYAKYWREKARLAELKPSPSSPLPGTLLQVSPTTPADISGVMKFDLAVLQSEVEQPKDPI
jgi:hypothetical protein